LTTNENKKISVLKTETIDLKESLNAVLALINSLVRDSKAVIDMDFTSLKNLL
jgi:hypothetical protein